MANTLTQIGETDLRVSLEFPDAKTRDDFEVAFRGWAKQYQQAAGTQQLVSALVAKEAAAARGEDTTGFLYSSYNSQTGKYFYLDII